MREEMNKTKKCTFCEQDKNLDSFYHDECTYDGYKAHCKKCDAEYMLKWRERNRLHSRTYMREYMRQYRKNKK